MSRTEDGGRYRDRYDEVGGVDSAKIKTGDWYKGLVLVKGKGEALTMSPLPTGAPLRAQSQAETGQCWEMVYDADDVLRSDSQLFNAKTDFRDN